MPYDLIEHVGKLPFYWKRCIVEGCEDSVCIGVSQFYCFPHSGATKAHLKYPKRNPVLAHEQERPM